MNLDTLAFATNADAGKIRAPEQLLEAPLESMMLSGFGYTRPAPDKEIPYSQLPRRHSLKKQQIGKQMAIK